MRLATLRNADADGELVVVSRDGLRFLPASAPANLRIALEQWRVAEPLLQALARRVDAGEGAPLEGAHFAAPLPRAWQWLDGSAFPSHGALMQQALGVAPTKPTAPLMYQGMSDKFFGPLDDAPFVDESLGIDFEGEFGVVVDGVPMGTSPDQALGRIALIVQINDWSLRTLAGPEMRTGFGWVQAKPACGMAPFAITPDELGAQWKDGRVCCDLLVDWNGARFGAANGAAMEYGFHDLVAHAARTRDLVPGTIIGSGTVSNENFREIGSSCIAERRGIEIVDHGEARTSFMRFGDTVRMTGVTRDGRSVFGTLEQRVVQARR